MMYGVKLEVAKMYEEGWLFFGGEAFLRICQKLKFTEVTKSLFHVVLSLHIFFVFELKRIAILL